MTSGEKAPEFGPIQMQQQPKGDSEAASNGRPPSRSARLESDHLSIAMRQLHQTPAKPAG